MIGEKADNKETKEPQSFKIILTHTCPDMTELNNELQRLRKNCLNWL
jgi:hypothetical protein